MGGCYLSKAETDNVAYYHLLKTNDSFTLIKKILFVGKYRWLKK